MNIPHIPAPFHDVKNMQWIDIHNKIIAAMLMMLSGDCHAMQIRIYMSSSVILSDYIWSIRRLIMMSSESQMQECDCEAARKTDRRLGLTQNISERGWPPSMIESP